MFTDEHYSILDLLADDPDDYDEDEDEEEEEDEDEEEEDDDNGGEKWYLSPETGWLSHKLRILLDFRPASFLH